jgi:hypothetical protein
VREQRTLFDSPFSVTIRQAWVRWVEVRLDDFEDGNVRVPRSEWDLMLVSYQNRLGSTWDPFEVAADDQDCVFGPSRYFRPFCKMISIMSRHTTGACY